MPRDVKGAVRNTRRKANQGRAKKNAEHAPKIKNIYFFFKTNTLRLNDPVKGTNKYSFNFFFFKQEISAHEAGTALALGLVMSGKGPRDRS